MVIDMNEFRKAKAAKASSAPAASAQRDGELLCVNWSPAYAVVVALTTEFVRGLALAGVLRNDRARRGRLLDEWIWAVRILLEQQPDASISPSDFNSGTHHR